MRRGVFVIVALVFLVAAGCAGPAAATREASTSPETVVIYAVSGDYDDVWDDVKMALGDRGLVISTISHVGEMIARTGKALGRTRPIFARAKVMSFCSAVISRNMLEQNPHLVAYCPYEIAVYSLPGAETTIYLSYRHIDWPDPQDRPVLDAVEGLLDGIVRDVAASYGGGRVEYPAPTGAVPAATPKPKPHPGGAR